MNYFRDHYNWSGDKWDLSINFTRWLLGVEWDREVGWIDVSVGCFQFTYYW